MFDLFSTGLCNKLKSTIMIKKEALLSAPLVDVSTEKCSEIKTPSTTYRQTDTFIRLTDKWWFTFPHDYPTMGEQLAWCRIDAWRKAQIQISSANQSESCLNSNRLTKSQTSMKHFTSKRLSLTPSGCGNKTWAGLI